MESLEKKYMPITYWAMLIGSLALIGFPGFSGFFSKDSIIMATAESEQFGAGFAHLLLVAGVFVTAFYSFRMFFLVFHAPESEYVRTHKIHESPKVVTVPLILLSLPAVLVGWPMIEGVLSGSYFADAVKVMPEHDVLRAIYEHDFHGAFNMIVHGLMTIPVWLSFAGVALAWFLYIKRPDLPSKIQRACMPCYNVLIAGYGFDRLNEIMFVNGGRKLGEFFWKVIDRTIIDGWVVNGSANAVAAAAQSWRRVQTGYMYHYAFAMIFGLLILLLWVLW
jgi:NADH-quinone oxidoreductase subunit L